MENLFTTAVESGNITAILAAVVVYVIIYFQRKTTETDRDVTTEKLSKEIATLKRISDLKQKDIEYLKAENSGVKEDIREMKNTLNQMAISLAKIAAKYEFNKD
jgi:predicted RNase H-like nuclease (RuvC/YqgF family)